MTTTQYLYWCTSVLDSETDSCHRLLVRDDNIGLLSLPSPVLLVLYHRQHTRLPPGPEVLCGARDGEDLPGLNLAPDTEDVVLLGHVGDCPQARPRTKHGALTICDLLQRS